MSTPDASFGGIFDRYIPARGGHAQWRWKDGDLNQAATRLIRHVESVLTTFAEPDHVWLATIENDLLGGRFPEVFESFFSDPTWDYTTRFYVPEMLKDSSESSSEASTLVCELSPGRLMHLLAFEGGFRWGSALRVGGVQVPEDSVPLVLKGSLFEPTHAVAAEKVANCAWAASPDLNALAMWARVQNDDWRARVKSLSTVRGSFDA